MSSEFQPEKPHPKTDGPEPLSHSSIFVGAGLAALTAILIMAIAVPRFSGDEEMNWILTVGFGLLAFLGVLAGGYWYRSSEE